MCPEQCGSQLAVCHDDDDWATIVPLIDGIVCDSGAVNFEDQCLTPATEQAIDLNSPEGQAVAAAIAADGAAPTIDPETGAWRYEKAVGAASNEKINWYFFDGASNGNPGLGNLRTMWVKLSLSVVKTHGPWLTVYTAATGTNDASWYHARINYLAHVQNPGLVDPDEVFVLYFGDVPTTDVFPEVAGVEKFVDAGALSPSPANPDVDAAEAVEASDVIFAAALQTNSGAPEGAVDFVLYSVGYTVNTVSTQILTTSA